MSNAICTPYVAGRVAGASGPAFADFPRTLARFAAGTFNVLVTWQRRAEERHRLRELDNRTLLDVGLSRSDIRAEAEKPFWTV